MQSAAEDLRGDRESCLSLCKVSAKSLERGVGASSSLSAVILRMQVTYRSVRRLFGSSRFGGIVGSACALMHASEDLRRDREVVLEAVKQDGYALQLSSEELRGDREVVLEAVRQNGFALQCVSGVLREDREVVLEAVKRNGNALQFASEELRGNHEVVLEVVRQNGYALRLSSEELRGDRESFLDRVREKGFVLRNTSDDLKRDREIVLEAVTSLYSRRAHMRRVPNTTPLHRRHLAATSGVSHFGLSSPRM